MFRGKQLLSQLEATGVRVGDSCCVSPLSGHKKKYLLNRHSIDLITDEKDAHVSRGRIIFAGQPDFHYRLELDPTDRFVLKTIRGRPFSINGIAAREAFVERSDRIYVEDHKLSFDSVDRREPIVLGHPALKNSHLVESDLNILIQGETGTGKSHLALQIHELSLRRGRFVAVNLSSYNPMLIESELFGHRKGSFTGAVSDREGAFAFADNGTLFLDEIDSLPMDLQTKLLTFLDNKTYRRVGETTTREIRTRLIFASGQSLEELVDKTRFRRDLFFRIKSGQTLQLEPLRDRPELIQDACDYFSAKNDLSFAPRLIEFYAGLPWPGNLRQLFGHLEKKRILNRGSKLDFDVADEELILQSSDLLELPEKMLTMEECKLQHLKATLVACNGNVALAAQKLCISPRTARAMLKRS